MDPIQQAGNHQDNQRYVRNRDWLFVVMAIITILLVCLLLAGWFTQAHRCTLPEDLGPPHCALWRYFRTIALQRTPLDHQQVRSALAKALDCTKIIGQDLQIRYQSFVIAAYLSDSQLQLVPLTLMISGENGNGKDHTLLRVADALNDLTACETSGLPVGDCQQLKGFISIQASELLDCEALKHRLIGPIDTARQLGYIPIVVINEIQAQEGVGACLLEVINSHQLRSKHSPRIVSMGRMLVFLTCNPHVLYDEQQDFTLTERTIDAQQRLNTADSNTYANGAVSAIWTLPPSQILELMHQLERKILPTSPLQNTTFRGIPDQHSTLPSKILSVPYIGHTVKSLTTIAEQVLLRGEKTDTTSVHLIAIELANRVASMGCPANRTGVVKCLVPANAARMVAQQAAALARGDWDIPPSLSLPTENPLRHCGVGSHCCMPFDDYPQCSTVSIKAPFYPKGFSPPSTLLNTQQTELNDPTLANVIKLHVPLSLLYVDGTLRECMDVATLMSSVSGGKSVLFCHWYDPGSDTKHQEHPGMTVGKLAIETHVHFDIVLASSRASIQGAYDLASSNSLVVGKYSTLAERVNASRICSAKEKPLKCFRSSDTPESNSYFWFRK